MYVPKTYWDTRQTFSFIARGAPDLIGPPAKYMPALEPLFDALLQGIATVSDSVAADAATDLFQRSRDQVRGARDLYRAHKPQEARSLLREAEANFVEARSLACRLRLGAAQTDTDHAPAEGAA